MIAPFFSIVTVVRNAEDSLRQTAQTLAKQTFRDLEWVIIDGNSTDGTRALALDQFATGTAIGVSEPDKGIYDAMNKGLALASGEYILFLNAGDRLLDSSSLETAAYELRKHETPDIGFFASLMDFGGRQVVRKVKPPAYIWHGQPGLHQATFIKRELHQRFLFSSRYKVVGDYDALARMSLAGTAMKSFDTVISINQFETKAMSGSNKLRLIREAMSVQREVLQLSRWIVAMSVARRSINSAAFRFLTALTDLRAS
ncbi:colanic acid biosynthesis glycosyltransferase WcaE [Novosphingobium sp. 11B]